MFVVSKLLQALLSPSNLIGALLVVFVIAMIFRRRRLAAVAGVLAALAFALFAWLPTGRLALGVLEDRFPQPQLPTSIAGIVMIGGAVDVHLTHYRQQPALNDAGERVTETMALMQRYPGARVVLSGGGADIASDEVLTEAKVAEMALVSMGAAQGKLELEEKSKTTCENATESRKLADPQPGDVWVLVTSASQMPRAVACFRAANFNVLAYPVDYRTKSDFWEDAKPVTASDGLSDADLAAHEWLGLLTYRLTGATAELFPAPAEK